jgi:alcohol dehydrogenase class IV
MLIASPYLFPRIAVLDPEMLQTLPAHLVAYTGMDAMTHAIEAFVSTECEPFSEALALRAVEMLHDNLPLAAASRDDIDALAKVQIAASMAGIACSNAALGATHAIAHSIGGLRGLHHGLSNAVALPVVMEYNLEARRSRYAALARAMGATAADETELAAAAVQGIRSLNRQLGIPAAYADLGIESSDTLIAEVAECAMNDPCLAFNPRPTEYVDMELLVRGCVMGAKR